MAHGLSTGEIVEQYPYLWRHQHERGETAGRKERPVCVALAVIGKDGFTHLALLPISSQLPAGGQRALELPKGERKLAGLSNERRAWVYVSEYNYDILERSHSMPPTKARRKHLSPAFLRSVLAAFRPTLERGDGRVNRR